MAEEDEGGFWSGAGDLISSAGGAIVDGTVWVGEGLGENLAKGVVWAAEEISGGDGGAKLDQIEAHQKATALNKAHREEIAKRINSNEQFLMSADIAAYLKHYEETHVKQYPPKFYTSITGDNAQRTRSHLLGVKGMEKFVNLETAKLSSLVPRVRIFQESRDSAGNTSKVEMLFDDHQTIDSIVSDRGTRGSGAGIKDISIDMTGNNVATAGRMYEVKLKMHFSSVEELFKERSSPTGRYKYVELFESLARDPGQKDDCKGNKSRVTNILRLEFGYHEPSYKTLNWTEAEKAVIREARRVLSLNLYKHNLDYNENGSLSLNLEYHGYTERNISKVDVFALGMDEKQRAAMRKLNESVCLTKKAKSSPRKKTEAETKGYEDKLKGEISKLKDMRTKAYASFLGQVMAFKMTYIAAYAAHNPRNGVMRLSDKVSAARVTTLAPSLFTDASIKKEMDPFFEGAVEGLPRATIHFFYLGDLLDRIISLAKEEPGFQGGKFEFCFGSFMFKDTQNSLKYEVPISAIPVGIKTFGEWFKENVQEKGERETYDLTSFLKDIVNLAKSSFTRDARLVAPPSTPALRSETFSTSKPIEKGVIHNPHSGAIPSGILKNGIQQKNLIEHYYIYGTNTLAETQRTANRSADTLDGIYWLVAANENGVTKKVKYSKSDTKYQTEMRLTSGGFDGKYAATWALYKANIDMVGNPIFKPGMTVYVTSNTFSHDAEALGLSGYFQILKVRNTIQGGKFQTELETIWTSPSNKKGTS